MSCLCSAPLASCCVRAWLGKSRGDFSRCQSSELPRSRMGLWGSLSVCAGMHKVAEIDGKTRRPQECMFVCLCPAVCLLPSLPHSHRLPALQGAMGNLCFSQSGLTCCPGMGEAADLQSWCLLEPGREEFCSCSSLTPERNLKERAGCLCFCTGIILLETHFISERFLRRSVCPTGCADTP